MFLGCIRLPNAYAALLTGKLVESQLFGVKGWGPLVLGLTVLLLAVTALAAGSFPRVAPPVCSP